MDRSDRPERSPGEFDVTVVGSCMTDLVTRVPRMPAMGETLIGSSFSIGFGGKGANQAVMAARLGARTAMVARVGDDPFGRDTLDNFAANGVDAGQVKIVTGASSGVAPITVQDDGQNIVLIVPGANRALDPAGVREARDEIAAAGVVLCQFEIPEVSVRTAFELARAAGAITLFNPAPAAALDDTTLGLADWLLPNETELEHLSGCRSDTLGGVEMGARQLIERGASGVIVTLGERGALIVDARGARHHTAPVVEAVDTTGAGDAFVGTFATLLARGHGADVAVQWACRVAAESVTGHGTQTSFPSLDELRRRGIDLPLS